MGMPRFWSFLAIAVLFLPPRIGAANYFEGGWEQFVRKPATQQELDPSNLDTNLLDAAVLHATNLERTKRGLQPLKHSEKARRAARMQSRIMRDRGSISHENPERRSLKTVEDRARAADLAFRFLAENVATAFDLQYESGKSFYPRVEGDREIVSYTPNGPAIPRHTYATFAEALVRSWMNSPGHRENILNPEAEFLGSSCLPDREKAAMRKFYCAQVFYAPAPPTSK
jgi:uncharacterized protein YkwD